METDVLIPEWIWLEVIGDDGRPLQNIYEHGWRTGTERVHVRFVFAVDGFEPGAASSSATWWCANPVFAAVLAVIGVLCLFFS